MIVLGGQSYDVPGVRTVSWRDDPAHVRQVTFAGRRTTWLRAIVLHSTGMAAPTVVRPGAREERDEWYFARYVNSNESADGQRRASWDATVRNDGVVLWHADPLEQVTWGANQVNPYALNIELEQAPDGALYEGQLEAAAKLVDFLTAQLGIARAIPWRDDAPDRRVLARLATAGGAGDDLVGVYGHRNVWGNRSDPGDAIFRVLADRGYLRFDYARGDDLAYWREVQRRLGVTPDGVPGPDTRAALAALDARARSSGGNGAALFLLAVLAWWWVHHKRRRRR